MVSVMAEKQDSAIKRTAQRHRRSQKRRYVQNQNKIARIFVSLILIIFMFVMTVQIKNINVKQQEYVAKQMKLEEQLIEEQKRALTLKEYKEYIESREYKEDIAISKLGLLYKNQIVFREKAD